MAALGARRNWSISSSSVVRLRGGMVVVLDSNSMDACERISFSLFWSEAEESSAGVGFTAGAFGGIAVRVRVEGRGNFGGGVLCCGLDEDGPDRIRSSNSRPACISGAISRSTLALARAPSTLPLTTIVWPSIIMELCSVMCPKTERTWETLSAQETEPTL